MDTIEEKTKGGPRKKGNVQKQSTRRIYTHTHTHGDGDGENDFGHLKTKLY